MLRKVLKDAGRYEAGSTHDYPRDVWRKIANDLSKDPANKEIFKGVKTTGDDKVDADRRLAAFSEPVDINNSLQSATRGPVKQRQRVGSPARPATR